MKFLSIKLVHPSHRCGPFFFWKLSFTQPWLNSPSVDKGRILSAEEVPLLAYPLRLETAPLDPCVERHEVPTQGHYRQIRDFK